MATGLQETAQRGDRGLTLQFAEQLLQAEKVALVPGDAFGACGEGFVRCSYASSSKNLSEALDRIGRFVKPLLNQ